MSKAFQDKLPEQITMINVTGMSYKSGKHLLCGSCLSALTTSRLVIIKLYMGIVIAFTCGKIIKLYMEIGIAFTCGKIIKLYMGIGIAFTCGKIIKLYMEIGIALTYGKHLHRPHHLNK